MNQQALEAALLAFFPKPNHDWPLDWPAESEAMVRTSMQAAIEAYLEAMGKSHSSPTATLEANSQGLEALPPGADGDHVSNVTKMVERLTKRAKTRNGTLVGASDGDTYTLGYYSSNDGKLDREAADLITTLSTTIEALKEERDANGREAFSLRNERDAARRDAANWLKLHDQQEERAEVAEAQFKVLAGYAKGLERLDIDLLLRDKDTLESSLAEAQLRIAEMKSALLPFAKCSEVYPNARSESEAAFGNLYDPRCPLVIGDFHAARRALSET